MTMYNNKSYVNVISLSLITNLITKMATVK